MNGEIFKEVELSSLWNLLDGRYADNSGFMNFSYRNEER